jgi:predicted NBD/HSP70 family sugar kinase
MNYLYSANTFEEQDSAIQKKNSLHKTKIIKYLYVSGRKTNAEICKHLKISAPTSFYILNELMEDEIVEKQGFGRSIGGRKPDLYGLKANSFYVLAIEINKYKTSISVFDNHHNNVGGIRSFDLEIDNNIETLDKLHLYANEVFEKSGIDIKKLVAVGISMPGLVDSHTGYNYTYFNYGEKSVRQLLEEKFHCSVFIENDAKAIALAELRFGLAKNKKNVLVLYLDWGIGLGLILNGKLFTGTSGFAGEFGHISIIEDDVLCHCGKRGCLEIVASGASLVRDAKAGVLDGKSIILNEMCSGNLALIDPKLVVAAAVRGDQFAINLLSEVGAKLGKGISLLIQLFNPELIILNGKVAEAGQYITIPIQQSLNTYCLPHLKQQSEIVISEMTENVGIKGAIAVAMENIFEVAIKSSSI